MQNPSMTESSPTVSSWGARLMEWPRRWGPIIGLLGLIGTAVGIKLGYDAAQGQATEFVDFFPAQIDDITQLLSRAQKQIVIVTDVAGYGQFGRCGKAKARNSPGNEANEHTTGTR